MIESAFNYRNKNETRRQKLKTSTSDDRNIVRYCKINPFASARSIHDELNLSVNTETVRRHLEENKLFARSPRKRPPLKKKHKEARI